MQQALTTPNMDMQVMKDMLAMQREVMAQQAVIDFNNDFSIMTAQIPVIAHTKKSYSTTYAPLEDIDKVIRPILSKNGFSVSFKNDQEGLEIVTVYCQLRHKCGHMIENSVTLPTEAATKGMNKQQAIGSALSYAKRYALCGILNITTTADDDNNGFAVNAKIESKKKPISDEDLTKGIQAINSGTYTLDKLLYARDLSNEQMMRVGREVNANE